MTDGVLIAIIAATPAAVTAFGSLILHRRHEAVTRNNGQTLEKIFIIVSNGHKLDEILKKETR